MSDLSMLVVGAISRKLARRIENGSKITTIAGGILGAVSGVGILWFGFADAWWPLWVAIVLIFSLTGSILGACVRPRPQTLSVIDPSVHSSTIPPSGRDLPSMPNPVFSKITTEELHPEEDSRSVQNTWSWAIIGFSLTVIYSVGSIRMRDAEQSEEEAKKANNVLGDPMLQKSLQIVTIKNEDGTTRRVLEIVPK